MSDPSDLVPPDDSGSRTFARYCYQAYHAFPLCLDCILGGSVKSVTLEHIEDIAVEEADHWRFIQVKTRDPEIGPWRLVDLLSDSGALHSLFRSYGLLKGVASRFEAHLEGAINRRDPLFELAKQGSLDGTLLERISRSLGCSTEECHRFMELVTVVPAPASRENVVDRNLGLLARAFPQTPSGQLEAAHQAMIATVQNAMSAQTFGDRWPEMVIGRQRGPRDVFEAKRLTAKSFGAVVEALKLSGVRAPAAGTPTALRDRANRLFEVVRRPWDPDRAPPGALLRADCAAAVPFHGRDDECADLEAWCDSESTVGIRLYSAAGGMGKTRLFVELCDRVKTRGWRAGFLLKEAADASTDLWSALIRQTAPLLLVVDYAESRATELISLLRAARDMPSGPVRIILLARAAGDWWEALKREGDGVGDLLMGPATRWHELRPLAMNGPQRLASYRIAAEAFAGALEKPVPSAEPDDLNAPHFERVLLLHMSAMAAIDGVTVKGDQGILNYVLNRERRFWSKQLRATGLPPHFEEGVAQAMAVVTLGGGAHDAKHARMILREIPLLNDQSEIVCRTIATLLHEAYPGVKFIEPMLPDLLGEHLVQVELGKDETLMDLVFGQLE